MTVTVFCRRRLDDDRPSGEVNVIPGESEDLALAHSGRNRKCPQGSITSIAQNGKKLVVDGASGEADQDRCQGRQPRSVRCVSDGGGGDPSAIVCRDCGEDCCAEIVAGSNARMTTPAENTRRNSMGEVRLYNPAARLFHAPGADAAFASCRTDGLACRAPGKMRNRPAVAKRTVIWGIPD